MRRREDVTKDKCPGNWIRVVPVGDENVVRRVLRRPSHFFTGLKTGVVRCVVVEPREIRATPVTMRIIHYYIIFLFPYHSWGGNN